MFSLKDYACMLQAFSIIENKPDKLTRYKKIFTQVPEAPFTELARPDAQKGPVPF